MCNDCKPLNITTVIMMNLYIVSYGYNSMDINHTLYTVTDYVIAPNHIAAEIASIEHIPVHKWTNLHTVAREATNINPEDYESYEGSTEAIVVRHIPVAA